MGVSANEITAFRLIRFVRVLRLMKVFPEVTKIVNVLMKSLASLGSALFLFLVVMYLYALIGVEAFGGTMIETNSQGLKIDPYGHIGEAMFSLLRATTGDDWTDLGYNLQGVHIPTWVIQVYHISWVIISSFLLLNIIVGAVVNNFFDESKKEEIKRDKEQNAMILEQTEKIDLLLQKIERMEKERV